MVFMRCLATDGRIAYQKNYLGGLKTDVFPNEKGDILAEALGDKDILLLANHGCIVAGRSIAQAMEDLYYLDIRLQFCLAAEGGVFQGTEVEVGHWKHWPQRPQCFAAAAEHSMIMNGGGTASHGYGPAARTAAALRALPQKHRPRTR